MQTITRWTNCRREGCGRELPERFQVYGFCNASCLSMHREEKDLNIQNAMEAFRREGEPNGGQRK